MNKSNFTPYSSYREYPVEEMLQRARTFREELQRRRTIRTFSTRPVLREIIEECLRAAGTAPSGANMQPWHFVVVSDPDVKKQIREGAEAEEREFYTRRASEEWLEALAPLGTDWHKPFLEEAPFLIIIFGLSNTILPDGTKRKNYYVTESVGIATGMLITALHHAGLASLTHTPSPMAFLNKILKRPANERPFLVLVVGYPAEGTTVPDISKKSLDEIATFPLQPPDNFRKNALRNSH
jgi:nitroreductase